MFFSSLKSAFKVYTYFKATLRKETGVAATRLSSIGLPTGVSSSHNFAIAKSTSLALERLVLAAHLRLAKQVPTQSRVLLSRHLVVLGDFPLSKCARPKPSARVST